MSYTSQYPNQIKNIIMVVLSSVFGVTIHVILNVLVIFKSYMWVYEWAVLQPRATSPDEAGDGGLHHTHQSCA